MQFPVVFKQDGGYVIGSAVFVGAVDQAIDLLLQGSSVVEEFGDGHVVDGVVETVGAEQQAVAGFEAVHVGADAAALKTVAVQATEEKAMSRLMKAIENPYTTILGHMTGRLLLSRNGYPVNISAVIAACKQHRVVIELNAHPRRLDLDWHFIPQAIEQGLLISIDPDAHSIEGYRDVRYGVLAAQKGALTKENNLSSFTRDEFEEFLASVKK